MSGSSKRLQARALAVLRAARSPEQGKRTGVDLIMLALEGKKGGFEKVIAMIDNMVGVLKKEQVDDDQKKEYCGVQLDTADDKKKALESTASNAAIAATNADEAVATLTAEIKALSTGIAELDQSVAEATEQRKSDNTAFTELVALNAQAKKLLGVAKNRLNQFYNPKLYVPPPKKELTQEESIYQGVVGPSLAQVSLHSQHRAAPAPPPETFDAYATKSQENTGVIASIDLLVKDLDKETTEAETSEKDAQRDYEKMLADAKAKRAADSKSITGKEIAKASFEEEAQSHKESKASATKELMATAEYIHGLHAECDWLVQNYDARKSARASEADSLANAKAVLSGSDYSLMQLRGTGSRRS
jgi:chromosome segregation ATPase